MKKNLDFKPLVILFDMDGVITDSINWWFKALTKVFNKMFGDTPSRKEFDSIVHETTYNIINHLAKKYNPTPEQIHLLSEQVDLRFEFEMIPNLLPIPGADSVILQLFNKGYRLGVVTNGSEIMASKMIEHLGFLKYMEIVIGCDGCNPKPSPDLLLRALDFFNIKAAQCVYIGDSYSDLLASERAGIEFVYKENRSIPEMAHYKGLKIKHLKQLMDLL